MTDAAGDFSPNLGLGYLLPHQAQKHLSVNEALSALDTLVMAAVEARGVLGPPVSPAEGIRYLLGASPTGAWEGLGGQLVSFTDGVWQAFAPKPGWRVWVKAEQRLVVFNGTDWRDPQPSPSALQGLTRLGVGTTADAANPLAVRVNSALLTAVPVGQGGNGDLRLTLNKEAAGDVGSLLMQAGWSGRAELGLIGGDDFGVKVSADGTAWTDALTVARTTGLVGLPQGVEAGSYNGQGVPQSPLILNGDFRINQRGTTDYTHAGGISIQPCPDLWTVGMGPGDRWQVLALEPGQTSVPGGALRCLRVTVAAGFPFQALQQRIEGYHLRGAVTLSFWVRASEAASLPSIRIHSDHGVGGSPDDVIGVASNVAVSTSWTRIVRMVTLPGPAAGAVAGTGPHLWLLIYFNLSTLSNPNRWFELADLKLEPGSTATPFVREPLALSLARVRHVLRRSEVALTAAHLAPEMRATPSQSGSGPF